MLVPLNTPSGYTPSSRRTWSDTPSAPIFYWTRIQLLNPVSGSVPSLALHLDKSALISADSLCPPCTCSHTRAHTADPYNSLIKWKPRYPFLHPRVNEYQWETDMTVLGMCLHARACTYACVCTYVAEWLTKKKGTILPGFFRTGCVAMWDFFFPLSFFYYYFTSFIHLHDIWIFIVPSP